MRRVSIAFSIFDNQHSVRLALHHAQNASADSERWGPAPLSKPFESMAELRNRLTSLGYAESLDNPGGHTEQRSVTEDELVQLGYEQWAISLVFTQSQSGDQRVVSGNVDHL
jgi:hypothetical protein